MLTAAQSLRWGRDPGAALGSTGGGTCASHGVPSTLLPPAPRGELYPRDEAAQYGANMSDAESIQISLCLPASCDQGRGRNNSFRTCSQNRSSQQWSPSLCPGLSPPATHVCGVKHEPCAASCVPCVPPRWAAGRVARGPSFIPLSHWPRDTVGLPTHLAAHPSQGFPQAGWIFHKGLFPGH